MLGIPRPVKYYAGVAAVAAASPWLSLRLIDPLPPRRITIASGPAGSLLHEHAQRYLDVTLAVGGVAAPALREALRNPTLALVRLAHTDAYVRRYRFLSKRTRYAGTVELEVARDVRDDQSYFEAAGEFPNVEQVDLPVAPDAVRHQRFGPSLLYRYLPFWAVTAVERFIIIVVPLLAVLLPAVLLPLVRLLPSVVAGRVRSRIYRGYGELALPERAVNAHADPAPIGAWLGPLQRLERAAERRDAPASFAGEVHTLREHIDLLRRAVLARAGGGVDGAPHRVRFHHCGRRRPSASFHPRRSCHEDEPRPACSDLRRPCRRLRVRCAVPATVGTQGDRNRGQSRPL
jgi:hypothetical protein